MAGALASGLRTKFAQALAGQLNSIGVVNDAIEDRIGERGNADQIVPTIHGNLAGDDERALVVAVLDDFEQAARCSAVSASGPQSSRISSLTRAERSQQPGVARIAVGYGQIGEQPGHASVEDG